MDRHEFGRLHADSVDFTLLGATATLPSPPRQRPTQPSRQPSGQRPRQPSRQPSRQRPRHENGPKRGLPFRSPKGASGEQHLNKNQRRWEPPRGPVDAFQADSRQDNSLRRRPPRQSPRWLPRRPPGWPPRQPRRQPPRRRPRQRARRPERQWVALTACHATVNTRSTPRSTRGQHSVNTTVNMGRFVWRSLLAAPFGQRCGTLRIRMYILFKAIGCSFLLPHGRVPIQLA